MQKSTHRLSFCQESLTAAVPDFEVVLLFIALSARLQMFQRQIDAASLRAEREPMSDGCLDLLALGWFGVADVAEELLCVILKRAAEGIAA